MARDNEQVCLLAFNVFGLVCILYSCSEIYNLSEDYMKLDQENQELCTPYLAWKVTFLLHIIFFFICLSFSVGTAQSYLNDEEPERANPSEHIYRLKFEKMVENSLDVVRVFCLLFCGPFILVECIMTIAYYKRIISGCTEIQDSFTNILVYILIILGCISLTVTAFCFYLTYFLGKTVKECWPQIRNPPPVEDAESTNESFVGGAPSPLVASNYRRLNSDQQNSDESSLLLLDDIPEQYREQARRIISQRLQQQPSTSNRRQTNAQVLPDANDHENVEDEEYYGEEDQEYDDEEFQDEDEEGDYEGEDEGDEDNRSITVEESFSDEENIIVRNNQNIYESSLN